MATLRSTTTTSRHAGVRRVGALALAVAALAGVTACEPTNRVANGRTLASGAVVHSPGQAFRFEVQTDGNLVLRKAGAQALWTSKTTGHPGATLTMRTNGVLALVSKDGRTVWTTPTYGVNGASLEVQADGNLVVEGTAGQPVWATGTSLADGTRRPLTERTTSSHQVTLTKMYEGYSAATPYANSSGNCTVGYGHLIHTGPCTAADRAKTWDADALFAADVKEHERRIKSSLGAVPVTQREFDTLFDYAFNRGSITATSSPKIYAAMTARPPRYAAVGAALREAGDNSIRGLCNRRYDEAEVFEGGRYDRTSWC